MEDWKRHPDQDTFDDFKEDSEDSPDDQWEEGDGVPEGVEVSETLDDLEDE